MHIRQQSILIQTNSNTYDREVYQQIKITNMAKAVLDLITFLVFTHIFTNPS